MKSILSISAILLPCLYLIACKKSNGPAAPTSPKGSFSFSINDSLINYPVDLVFIQDVSSRRTALITGQYADTSSKQGSLSLRLIGDTTGRYRGDSLLVTYTNASGETFYNTSDSSNYVQVDKFSKVLGGIVSGSFSVKAANGADSISLSKGTFTAFYQD
jgi:hypothetical protein